MNLEEQWPQVLDFLCALRPEFFQRCFSEWINRLIGSSDGKSQRHVAVDGKTLRGSSDTNKGIGPLHLVSAWASEKGLTLAQVPTDRKSNDVTAIPEPLKLIDPGKSIITMDAMGTQ